MRYRWTAITPLVIMQLHVHVCRFTHTVHRKGMRVFVFSTVVLLTVHRRHKASNVIFLLVKRPINARLHSQNWRLEDTDKTQQGGRTT